MRLITENCLLAGRNSRLGLFRYFGFYLINGTKFRPTSELQQIRYQHSNYKLKAADIVKSKINNYGKHFSTTNIINAIFNVQDEEDFQVKVMKSDKPVVVDFHAAWCGPCKILGPRLESVIGSKEDKVHLAKIDIDAVSDLALAYGVSAVPSVLAIKNGKVTDKFVGLQDETRIDAFVRKLIEE